MSLPTAYVINLDRCPDNWAQTQSTWEGIFDLQRISAVDARTHAISGAAACKQSHLTLLKELANREESFQIILEDDVYPTAAFKELWPKLQIFLESRRTDWDFIVLDPLVQFEKPTLDIFTPDLFIISRSRSTGAIIYRTGFIKENIDAMIKICERDGAIDMMLTHASQYRKLTPQYLIMRQRSDKGSQISGWAHVGLIDSYYDNTEKYLEDARKRLYEA